MVRKTRSPEEIQKIKDNIIEEALTLIHEVGFNNMSMRKLAGRVGMSATNLYYYYANQDEIYLNIQIRGFTLLYEIFEKIYYFEQEPVSALQKMASAYLNFGFNNSDYYRIMLNSDTPRYTEYIGTEIEPIALVDKEISLNVIDITAKVIKDISKNNPSVTADEANFLAKQLWITLHGIVVLHNRDILQEVDDDPETLIYRICDDMINKFL